VETFFGFIVLSYIAFIVLCVSWLALAKGYKRLLRALESPEKRATRIRVEADLEAKFRAEDEAHEARRRQQFRDEEIRSMRGKWSLYQNIMRVETLNSLSADQFEILVGRFFEARGYSISMVGGTGDFGVDIIAMKGKEKLAVQVKRYSGKVGPSAIQQAYSGGHFQGCNCAAVVTSSYFTDAAETMARTLRVRLFDRRIIGKWLEAKGVGTRAEFTEADYLANKATIDGMWHSVESKRSRPYRRWQH